MALEIHARSLLVLLTPFRRTFGESGQNAVEGVYSQARQSGVSGVLFINLATLLTSLGTSKPIASSGDLSSTITGSNYRPSLHRRPPPPGNLLLHSKPFTVPCL